LKKRIDQIKDEADQSIEGCQDLTLNSKKDVLMQLGQARAYSEKLHSMIVSHKVEFKHLHPKIEDLYKVTMQLDIDR
jgi:C4-dicarboxylate-specific signal transduction histidine kinase